MALLPKTRQIEIADTLEREGLLEYSECAWPFVARDEQRLPLGNWRYWLLMAGRGFGKTRTGAESVRDEVEEGRSKRICLVARTSGDVRDVMVEGESGILATADPEWRPEYIPSKRRLTWPNGAIATTYTADKPDMLRGPQHDFVWADEIATYRYPDTMDQLKFGLRLGQNPRAIFTTTPRPVRIIRDLITDPHCVVTSGSTYDNKANLPDVFLNAIIKKYEGTTLGQQEIYARLLDEMPGALWSRKLIDKNRVQDEPKDITRIVVAIDPSVTSKDTSDEAGIIVGCVGSDQHGYVLSDLSRRDSPDNWGRVAIEVYKSRQADRIIAEVNQGGDLVEGVLRTIDKNIAYLGIHASKGKRTRAEPIAALYEQGRIHHVGVLEELEDEMCSWVSTSGDPSPNRMDALVYCMTELMLNEAAIVAPSSSLDMGNVHRV